MLASPFRRSVVLGLAGALFTGGMLPAEAAAKTPSKPAGVRVTSQVNSLGVSWSSARNAVSYTATAVPTKGSKKAKRRGTKSCTAIEPTTWCVIPNLVNNKKYSVKVVAKNGTKRSGSSSTKFSIPRSAAASVIITGIVTGGDTAGMRVVAVMPSGQTYSSQTLGASGFFYFDVDAPNSVRVNATVHLIAANGTYLGPVVFNTRGAVGLGSLTDDNDLVDLGYVRLKGDGAWALTSKVPPLSNTAVSFDSTSGRPAGAGLDGFVPTTAAIGGPSRMAAAVAGLRLATFSISACDGLAADAALGSCWTLAKAQLANCSTVTPDPSTYNDLVAGSCKDELGVLLNLVSNENPCSSASETYGFGGTLCWLAIRVMSTECGDDVIAFGATIDAMSPACQTALRSLLSGGGGGGGGGDECGDLNLGGDDDGDGIINAIDVDDDNDGIVDPADPDANNACSIEPTKSMRTALGDGLPLNVGVLADSGETPAEFNTRVNERVASGGFGIGYYAYDKRFFPGAYTDADGNIPAVWAECTGVVWCDPVTSRALNDTNIEQRNNLAGDFTESTFPEQPSTVDDCNADRFFMYYCEKAFDSLVGDTAMIAGTSKCATLEGKTRSYRMPCWSEVTFPMRFGSTSTSCGGGTTLRYDQTYAPDLAAGVLNGKRNFFWQTVCQEDLGGGNMRTSQVIGASLTPNLGAMAGTPDVADAIHATDVVTLAYPTDRTGGIGRVATTIGAYPVTTPMVTQFGLVPVGGGAVLPKVVTYVNPDGSNPTYGSTPNGGTAANRAIVIGKDQKLQVTFYRPQRTSFQQEYDATQPITKYHDLHGLNYGIQLEVGQLQFGCGPSTDDGRGNFPNGANQYTVDGSFTDTSLAEGGETGASVLTPIKDNTDVATGGLADSATEVPGSNTLTFTIDLAQCIAERLDFINAGNGLTDPASQLTVDDFVVASNSYHGSPTTAPLGDGSDLQGVSDKLGQVNHDEYTCIRINLAARGEAKTGGTDSAIQEMCIQFATDAFVGTSTNYLDGRTPPAP